MSKHELSVCVRIVCDLASEQSASETFGPKRPVRTAFVRNVCYPWRYPGRTPCQWTRFIWSIRPKAKVRWVESAMNQRITRETTVPRRDIQQPCATGCRMTGSNRQILPHYCTAAATTLLDRPIAYFNLIRKNRGRSTHHRRCVTSCLKLPATAWKKL